MKVNRQVYKYVYIIVDGYNYINHISEFKRLSKISLEEARYALIERLREYRAFTGYKVILVFDAYNRKNSVGNLEILDNDFEVVYTKKNQTADSYIEKLANKLASDKKNMVRVVTSDWAEQLVILGSGAFRMSTRELNEEMAFMKKKINTKKRAENQRSYLEDILSEEILKKLKNISH